MTLRNPPSWLQNGLHPAENDRLTAQAQYSTTGIIGSASLLVSAQASPNMTVNVDAGWCAILGSTSASGVYVAYNDATVIETITAADPSLPRIDRVVVTVSDAYYSGSTNNVAIQVLAGTPDAVPVAPSTPSNSISLATIAVGAGVTTITAANITDTRVAFTSTAFLPITGGTVTGATTFSSGLTLAGATTISGAVTASNTITSTSTIAGQIRPTAGTTTVAPLKFTSGTNLTAVQAGTVEYDGTVAYFTPSATSGRGLLGADSIWAVGNTDLSLASSTSTQSPFGLTNGFAVVSGVSYEYEIVLYLTTGTNSHYVSFRHDGTATIGSVLTVATTLAGTAGTAAAPSMIYDTTTASNVALYAASTASSMATTIRGKLYFTASGYWQPNIKFSATPGGTNLTKRGSFVRIRPIATGTSNIAVGAWS